LISTAKQDILNHFAYWKQACEQQTVSMYIQVSDGYDFRLGYWEKTISDK